MLRRVANSLLTLVEKAMSGKVSKSQIPVIPHVQVPADAKAAIIRLKNDLKMRQFPERFKNKNPPGMGSPLPNLANGCGYFEVQVGAAHAGDPRSAGSRRLVVEINEASCQIMEIYFTGDHYQKGTFARVI